jgi:o-succinylbenzoate synthase
MSVLRRVVLREIHLPLREPFRISSGECAERRILLLELEDEEGIATFSECVAGEAPNYSPETVETAWLALASWLVPSLLGRPLPDPRATGAVLDRHVRGHRMAKAALEMGVWGLAAVRAGASLSSTLGGTRERIEVGLSLGMQASPEQLVAKAQAAVAAGYRRVKLKIGRGADLEYVRAVRAAVGPGVRLTVDANTDYTLADADLLARLDDFDLAMIEQPLDREDLLRHAELQRRLRTPICLDESITSAARVEDMIALGAGRIVNIKPGRVGGLGESLRIHDICAAAGIPVWCGGMLESGVGRAYNVALASLPNFTLPNDTSPSARYWERDIVTPEWTMSDDGWMTVPTDRPGLGVSVDRDRIDDLTVRAAELG